MNEFSTVGGKTSKSQKSDSLNQLLTNYGDQRSIGLQSEQQKTSESSFNNLMSLNLSPWDYNLDSNIEIKSSLDVEQIGLDLPINQYLEWYKMHHSCVGDKNAVSFASMKIESDAYEEQYLSLKLFLAGCNSHYKRELACIMFPMFVHFYLDLIHKPDLVAAQSFYNKFNTEHDESLKKDVLRNLIKITSATQIQLYSNIHSFRKHKFILKLSTQVYMYLIEHLRHGNYTLVLQTFNTHFILKSSTSLPINTNGHNINNKIEQPRKSLTADKKEELVTLEKTIKDMNNTAHVLKPSICIFSFVNAYEGLTCASFSSDSCMLAAGSQDASVSIWKLSIKNELDLKSLEGIQEKSLEQHPTSKDCSTLRSHTAHVYATNFFYNNNYLLSASQDKSVILWDVHSKKGLVQYKGHSRSVWDVCSSPQSSFFASCSLDRTVKLWNTEYAYPMRAFAGHYESVNCVTFHPNGNYVASGSTDKTVRLWDLQSGQFVRLFVGHTASINSLAFTHDGQYMVSAGDDNTILIWDLTTSKILKKLYGHTKPINSLCFSADNSMLASAGLDTFINIWECDSILKKDDTLLVKNSTNQIGSYPTNSNSILTLNFSVGNLLLGASTPEVR